MKYVTIITLFVINSIASYAQNQLCGCYEKVKVVAADNEGFQECLKMHRKIVEEQNNQVIQLYKNGDRAKAKEIFAEQKLMKACYYPYLELKPSKLTYQFEDLYGVINLVDFSVDFTSKSSFTGDANLTIEWADYDRSKKWKRPNDASTGEICIFKKNDSLVSCIDFNLGDYSVKRKDNESEWIFYVNYNIKGQKYSGQYNGAMPKNDSNLKLVSNNGRYLELEFSLITEQNQTLKGFIQTFYPFKLKE